MKTILPILFIFLSSCNSGLDSRKINFIRSTPDTSNTWAGRMTRLNFLQTRDFEKVLRLKTMNDGTMEEEVRVWYLSSSYNKHVLFIAKPDSLNQWTLRTISFYQKKPDSIYADYSKTLRQSSVDSLHFYKLWQLTSQSDMINADSFGCLDGQNLLIEIANQKKYRYLWYSCPESNKNKDTVFLSATILANRLDAFAVEH